MSRKWSGSDWFLTGATLLIAFALFATVMAHLEEMEFRRACEAKGGITLHSQWQPGLICVSKKVVLP